MISDLPTCTPCFTLNPNKRERGKKNEMTLQQDRLSYGTIDLKRPRSMPNSSKTNDTVLGQLFYTATRCALASASLMNETCSNNQGHLKTVN